MQAQPRQPVHAPPARGEDAVLHRRKRAGGADLAAPSSMVDPSDDAGEGGPTTTKQRQDGRSRLVRAYRVILILIHARGGTGQRISSAFFVDLGRFLFEFLVLRCSYLGRVPQSCVNGSFNIRTRQGGCEQVGHTVHGQTLRCGGLPDVASASIGARRLDVQL
eukprot:2075043-Prymnesium_polylepis.1